MSLKKTKKNSLLFMQVLQNSWTGTAAGRVHKIRISARLHCSAGRAAHWLTAAKSRWTFYETLFNTEAAETLWRFHLKGPDSFPALHLYRHGDTCTCSSATAASFSFCVETKAHSFTCRPNAVQVDASYWGTADKNDQDFGSRAACWMWSSAASSSGPGALTVSALQSGSGAEVCTDRLWQGL